MTTHEKQDPTVATTAPDPEVNNVSVDAYNDEDVAAVMVDIENQQQQPPQKQCSVVIENNNDNINGAVDAPADGAAAASSRSIGTGMMVGNNETADGMMMMTSLIRNNDTTMNDSMTSENCKIINESDSSPQQYTPCPVSPAELADNTNMIPDSPNLTPVKLDADLLKHKDEQETVTSSPTYSSNRDPNNIMPMMDDSKDEPDDDETIPLSRRQQRLRPPRPVHPRWIAG